MRRIAVKRVVGAGTVILAAVGCYQPDQDMSATMATADPLAAYAPTPAQRADVVQTLQLLFDALESGDEALLRSVVDPSVVMHSSETRDGATTFGSTTLDGLAARISSSEVTLIERMWDPVVVVNGALATIWTPYDFYSGETFSHCGVDAFQLVRVDGVWKIVSIAFTRRNEGCDDAPPP